MMKRITGILIWIVLCAVLCAGCGGAMAEEPENKEMTEEFYPQPRISDEQAEKEYLNGLFGLPVTPVDELPRMRGSVSGDRFEEGSLKRDLYDALKTRVTQAAAGTVNSTVFTLEPADYGNHGYTPAEIGAASGDEKAVATYVVSEVKQVIQALLYDCPYEMYWYDKTSGTGIGYSYGSEGGKVYTDLTLAMLVSADYSASGAKNTTDLNTAKIANVQNAVNTAATIRDQNASLGNYAKLTAYKNAICNLVDYNNDAAAGGVNYGNPWLLVYVFDGDPNTKVVCEGYSKAFQYLCDISRWNGPVSVISVSGVMNGGTGSGNHMWNLVRMNGLNYLADVTNSDEGTSGQFGGLFLDGYDRTAGSGSSTTYYYTTEGKEVPLEDGSILVYPSGEVAYTYNEQMSTLFAADRLAPSDTAADPNAPDPRDEPTLTVDQTSILAGQDIHITAYIPGAEHIRVGSQSGAFVNDSFTDIQEGDTGEWTAYFGYPGEYTLFVAGWSDERWNHPNPDARNFPDLGGIGTAEVTVTVTALEEENTPSATITIPEPLNQRRTITVEIPEFTAAISYTVTCRREDTWETVYTRTETEPFSTSIECWELEANAPYAIGVDVRRNGYTSYSDWRDFQIWAPTIPESITPGEDVTITIPEADGADGYELIVEGPSGGNEYAIDSRQAGSFTIPGMVFADGGNYVIIVRVYQNSTEHEWTDELHWIDTHYDLSAYEGAQTLTISAEQYAVGAPQAVSLSAADADQVIIQEKGTNGWGYPYWYTLDVIDDPGAIINVYPENMGHHTIRAAVKKNGVWSAWSETTYATGTRDTAFTITARDQELGPVTNPRMATNDLNYVWVEEAPEGISTIEVCKGDNRWIEYPLSEGITVIQIEGYEQPTPETPLVARYTTADGEKRYSNVLTPEYVDRLATPTATVPETLAAGEPLEIILDSTANANEYEIHVSDATARVCSAYPTAGGPVTLKADGLSKGTYTIRIQAITWSFRWMNSKTAEYTLTVTAAPYQWDAVLPADLKVIEENAFTGSGIKSVKIPDGCERIKDGAFAGAEELEVIYIPASVTQIGENAIPTGVIIVTPAGSPAETWAGTNYTVENP